MFARILLVATLLASPALADLADCQADLEVIGTALKLPAAENPRHGTFSNLLPEGAALRFENGRCVIDRMRIPIYRGAVDQVFSVGPIRWQAEWLDPSRPFPPKRLALDIDRIEQQIVPFSRDPANPSVQTIQYQMRLVSALNPARLGLEMTYDPDSAVLEVTRMDGSYGPAASFMLKASIHDFDASWRLGETPPLDKLSRAKITAADLTLTNGGLFEQMAAAWLRPIFPALGDTPEAAVTAAQQIARDQIAAMPETLTTTADRAALTAVVDSVPHPLGTLRLHLNAPHGLEPARFAATAVMVAQPSWNSFAGLLGDARLTAEWAPAPGSPAP